MSAGYRVGDLLIDLQLRRVIRDGADLKVVGRSFELLVALVRAAPRLVSTVELMERVWPGVVVNPETLTQRVKLLRQALADDADSPRYVVASRGFGYRIAPDVETLAALPQPPPTIPPAPSSGTTIAAAAADHAAPSIQLVPGKLRRVPVPFVLALLLTSGAAGTWWSLEHRSALTRPADLTVPSPVAVPRSSVAVMPFANLTGTPTKDYLGDGMAEELISALARVPGLKVPARTSTFAYKGRNGDIRRIAQELGVATVLEGSVRAASEHLRISARLVDAASGYEIWSQDYDRPFNDIFRLQDDLAAEIVQALRGYVKVDLPAPAPHPSVTRDVQAYEFFLQAEAVFRGNQATAPQTVAFLDQALARDPDFSDALALRAAVRAMPVVLGTGSVGLLDDVDGDATRALALDPSSAEGHATQEMVQALHWRWLDAEQSYRATMVANASDPYFRDFHSFWLLEPAGRLRQDESELIASYHLAPAHGFTLHELVVAESLLGHDAEAVRYAELFHDIVANGSPVLGEDALPYVRRALRAGHYTEVSRWATLSLSAGLRTAGGREAIQAFCAALGDPMEREKASRALRSFIPRLIASTDSERVKMFFVDALVMLGDLDGAYQMTERFLDSRLEKTGSGGVEWNEIWAPEMRPFRRDPRFQSLVTRLKLIDYWRQYGPPDECDLRDGTLMCR